MQKEKEEEKVEGKANIKSVFYYTSAYVLHDRPANKRYESSVISVSSLADFSVGWLLIKYPIQGLWLYYGGGRYLDLTYP